MRTLPPFDSLVAFDAVLRHGSVTRAAHELGITQSAASHRLRKLESFIGIPLLNRTGGGLVPTAAGVSLAQGLGPLLDEVAQLRGRARAAVAPKTLKIGVGSALATFWLARRIPRFAARHPGVALELVILDGEPQARSADVDIRILWLPRASARASSTQRILFTESVFPVAARTVIPGGRMLEDPRALARLPIVHKGSAREPSGAEWSWSTWFERLGVGAQVPAGVRFDTMGTALAAAMEGAGVTLGRSLLVRDALEDGRLVRVLPESWDAPSSKVHVLRWAPSLGRDRRVQGFVRWIIDEAAASSGALASPALAAL